jgi:hypothetical protein
MLKVKGRKCGESAPLVDMRHSLYKYVNHLEIIYLVAGLLPLILLITVSYRLSLLIRISFDG